HRAALPRVESERLRIGLDPDIPGGIGTVGGVRELRDAGRAPGPAGAIGAGSFRLSAMRTSRLEAFSDGVITIAAALVVLELPVPAATTDLCGTLLLLWP